MTRRHDRRPAKPADHASPERAPRAPRKTAPDPRHAQPRDNRVDEASMESFPCSDPPGYYTSHV